MPGNNCKSKHPFRSTGADTVGQKEQRRSLGNMFCNEDCMLEVHKYLGSKAVDANTPDQSPSRRRTQDRVEAISSKLRRSGWLGERGKAS